MAISGQWKKLRGSTRAHWKGNFIFSHVVCITPYQQSEPFRFAQSHIYLDLVPRYSQFCSRGYFDYNKKLCKIQQYVFFFEFINSIRNAQNIQNEVR